MPDVIPGQAQAADPVALISAILEKENAPESKEEVKADTAQPEQDAEYQPEQNTQVEGEDAKDEGEKPAEIPLDQLESIELEVEVSGDKGKVTEKLPIKELKLGYMRQKDYQQKTAEVARQREEVPEKIRQAVEGERTQYQQNLQQLYDAVLGSVAPELKNADWNHLATNDPFKYVELRNRAEQIGNVLNSIKAKQQEVDTKAKADKAEADRVKATKTWSMLESEIPGWNAELYQSILKAGESVGVSPQETGTWLDAGQIKILHKAYLYDQLKAGKPPAEKKVVVPPKAITPGTTSAVPKKAQQAENAKERLRKSGKLNDLADYIATKL